MTNRQAKIFLEGEGEAWLKRNEAKLPPKEDPVLDAIKTVKIYPKNVLEIGCANGWRLIEIAKRYNCVCSGIDPALLVTKTIAGSVCTHRGTADNLYLFNPESVDLLIYGFCLYLCDPDDYFKIAAEGDRVLVDGGHLIIYDFYLDAFDLPHSRPYKHDDRIRTHKMRFENLWKGHPAYRVVKSYYTGFSEDMTAVIVLKKDTKNAFPVTE